VDSPTGGSVPESFEGVRARFLAIAVERRKSMPLVYRNLRLDCGYRIDLLVEKSVVVEIKSIEKFKRVHGSQLVTYLQQSECKVGLVINFNVQWLADQGILRRVNGFPE
jgi:GxxExxY protein